MQLPCHVTRAAFTAAISQPRQTRSRSPQYPLPSPSFPINQFLDKCLVLLQLQRSLDITAEAHPLTSPSYGKSSLLYVDFMIYGLWYIINEYNWVQPGEFTSVKLSEPVDFISPKTNNKSRQFIQLL